MFIAFISTILHNRLQIYGCNFVYIFKTIGIMAFNKYLFSWSEDIIYKLNSWDFIFKLRTRKIKITTLYIFLNTANGLNIIFYV